MNKHLRHIKLSKLTNTPLNEWYQDLDDFIESVFPKLIIKEDRQRYPYDIFYFLDDKLYLEYNETGNGLCYNEEKIYLILKSKLDSNGEGIKDLIKGIVEEHLNLVEFHLYPSRFNFPNSAEEHFNLMEATLIH